MKYYKITLGGRGSEIYPFKINEDQLEKFIEGDVERDGLNYDEICELLGVESYFDSPNETYMGPYTETFYMKVENELGEIVYETESFDYDNCNFTDVYCDDNKYLLIEDYCKGEHIVYDLPLEEEFDINKLSYNLVDISCQIELVCGINYGTENCELYKSYGDTLSKGYYYHLINQIVNFEKIKKQ
jgi:hypothetical protein